MNVHHGIIKSFEYEYKDCSPQLVEQVRSLVVGQKLQDIRNWPAFLKSNIPRDANGVSGIAGYLEEYLPIPEEPAS